MERIAADNGIEIEFVRSRKSFRKEDRVKAVLDQRGDRPGVVCILSAMEPCGSYKPWHDKKTHKTYLKPDDGKCLHYYVYFIDEDLGLCSPAGSDLVSEYRVPVVGQRLRLDRRLRAGTETG
jgi:hypothetical protein